MKKHNLIFFLFLFLCSGYTVSAIQVRVNPMPKKPMALENSTVDMPADVSYEEMKKAVADRWVIPPEIIRGYVHMGQLRRQDTWEKDRHHFVSQYLSGQPLVIWLGPKD